MSEVSNNQTLPDNWSVTTGKDLFEWSSGKNLTAKQLQPGNIQVYGGNGISGHHNEALIDYPTMIIGRVGAHCGNVYSSRGPAWITDNAIYAKHIPNGIVLPFIEVAFQLAKLNDISGGSGQPFVNQRMLNDVCILLPPTSEQRRIVDAIDTQLTRLDAAVTALKRTQANLKRYRASVLKTACEGRLVPTEAELAKADGSTYESADQLLQRILVERRQKWEADAWQKEIDKAKQKAAKAQRKADGRPLQRGEKLDPTEWQTLDEEVYSRHLLKNDKWKEKYKEPESPDTKELPELPDGWVWAKMEQVVEQRLGKMLDKAKNKGTLRPYLRNINVRWFHFNLSDIQHMRVTDEELDEISVCQGDLVVCEGGEPGRCAIWEHPNETMVIQKALHRVRPYKGLVSSWYLAYCFAADANTGRLEASFTGSTIKHFTGQSLRSYAVPIPPVLEQERIVTEIERRLSIADQLEKTVETDLARAERLRQSILKQAFEGKLVPQDPNDEPASVLLERIQAERNGQPV